MILWLSVCCVLSGPFATAEAGLYTHIVLVVIVRPYTFEGRIHNITIELPNFIEGLVRVSTLYAASTSNLSNRWYSEYNF